MKKSISAIALALFVATTAVGTVSSTGCATIFAGGPDRIAISSMPQGATVFVDGQPIGPTPIVISLDRQRSSGNIRVEAPGYAPAVISRAKGLNGWFIVTILCTGILPLVVDLITGDYEKFDDTPIMVNLVPAGMMPGPMPGPAPGPAPMPMGPGGAPSASLR